MLDNGPRRRPRVAVLARVLACRARAEADRLYTLATVVHDHAGVEVSLELDSLNAHWHGRDEGRQHIFGIAVKPAIDLKAISGSRSLLSPFLGTR